jgi:hypothetical protein
LENIRSNPYVQFDNINVNAIDTNAGIFIGTNGQNNWSSNNNTKSGFGSLFGKFNLVSKNINIVKDDDVIDTPITSY